MTKQEYFELCDELSRKETHLIEESHAYKSIGKPDKYTKHVWMNNTATAELINAIEEELNDGSSTTELSWLLSHLGE